MKNKIQILSVAISALMICACGKPKSSLEQEDVQLRAYRLIDDNRVDDAISLLTKEIDSRDKNSLEPATETKELKVTLASAYAKKSGISIFQIARAFQKGKQISSFKLEDFEPKSGSTKDNNGDLRDLSKLLLGQLKVLQMLDVVPQVDQEKSSYLNHAVRILKATPNLAPADLIYSAILKLILARTIVGSEGFRSALPRVEKENNQCVAKPNEFGYHLTKTAKLILSGLEDLGKAMPEKQQEIETNSKAIANLVASTATLNTSGIVLNTLNAAALNTIYKSLGLRSEELNCESNEVANK